MNNEQILLNVLAKESPLHVRKLARLTNLNPNTIINLTEKLVDENILTKIQDSDTKRVYIDFAKNKKAIFKKISCNVDGIYDSGLIDELEIFFAYPSIILFGSFAKGENHADSDIDLFIITEDKKEFDCSKFERKLGYEIELFVHTPKEFQELRKSSKELLNNVLNGIKLSGYTEVF